MSRIQPTLCVAGVCVAAALLGSTPAIPEAEAASPSRCQKHADADLFIGVFFGEGPAASSVPRAIRDQRALVRGQDAAARAKTLERIAAHFKREGKRQDAKLAANLAKLYQRAGKGGKSLKVDGKASSKERAEFAAALNKRYPGALKSFGSALRSKDPAKVRQALRDNAARVIEIAGSSPTAGDDKPEKQLVIDTAVATALIIPQPPLTGTTGSSLSEDKFVALLTSAFGC